MVGERSNRSADLVWSEPCNFAERESGFERASIGKTPRKPRPNPGQNPDFSNRNPTGTQRVARENWPACTCCLLLALPAFSLTGVQAAQACQRQQEGNVEEQLWRHVQQPLQDSQQQEGHVQSRVLGAGSAGRPAERRHATKGWCSGYRAAPPLCVRGGNRLAGKTGYEQARTPAAVHYL